MTPTLLNRAAELLLLRDASGTHLSKDAGPEEDDFYAAAHQLVPDLVRDLQRRSSAQMGPETPEQELLVAACAVLREHHGSAFTIAEYRLAATIMRLTGQPWPQCLGEPRGWELPQTLAPKPQPDSTAADDNDPW